MLHHRSRELSTVPDHDPTIDPTDPSTDPSTDPATDPGTHLATAPLPPALGRPGRRRLAFAGAGALLTAGLVVGGVYAVEQGGAGTSGTAGTQVPSAQGAPSFGFGGPPSVSQQGQGSVSSAAYSPESYGDASTRQSTGLVEISSTLSDGTARGTGIIWTSDGTVVTNHHVVAGATAIKV
ncbi:MAG: hypothetical protein ACJ72E_07475, partial [Marmoricola sp.]